MMIGEKEKDKSIETRKRIVSLHNEEKLLSKISAIVSPAKSMIQYIVLLRNLTPIICWEISAEIQVEKADILNRTIYFKTD